MPPGHRGNLRAQRVASQHSQAGAFFGLHNSGSGSQPEASKWLALANRPLHYHRLVDFAFPCVLMELTTGNRNETPMPGGWRLEAIRKLPSMARRRDMVGSNLPAPVPSLKEQQSYGESLSIARWGIHISRHGIKSGRETQQALL